MSDFWLKLRLFSHFQLSESVTVFYFNWLITTSKFFLGNLMLSPISNISSAIDLPSNSKSFSKCENIYPLLGGACFIR